MQQLIRISLFIWTNHKGGSGVWGNLPMGAHSSLNKDEAKSMVKYILSLKK
jgi:cytochrome c